MIWRDMIQQRIACSRKGSCFHTAVVISGMLCCPALEIPDILVGCCHPCVVFNNILQLRLLSVSQVFDKALTETTFCEIYAELCYQLNNRLPSFEPEVHDGRKRPTTFRCAVPSLHALTAQAGSAVLA